MHRGLVLLATVAGGAVAASLVQPGQAPPEDGSQPIGYVADAAELEAFLKGMLAEAGDPPLIGAAVTAEGPEAHGVVSVTDQGWELDLKRLRSALGTPRVFVRSAVIASALAAPGLGPGRRRTVCEGAALIDAPIIVVGAETILAAAFAFPDPAGGWVAAASQGALVTPRPATARETQLVNALAADGWTTMEQIVSRKGLVRLHAAVRAMDGGAGAPSGDDPLAVATLARSGDAQAAEAISVFSGWLGGFARQMALMGAARGGVVLTGPFLRDLGDAFDETACAERFRNPAAPGADYVRDIAVYRARAPMALLGLSTLFNPSDARFGGAAVHLLDC